jgi:hypothetical protein
MTHQKSNNDSSMDDIPISKLPLVNPTNPKIKGSRLMTVTVKTPQTKPKSSNGNIPSAKKRTSLASSISSSSYSESQKSKPRPLSLAPWEKNFHPQSCNCDECVICTSCNDKFETKRGLIIHFSRLHRDQIQEPEPTVRKPTKPRQSEIKMKQKKQMEQALLIPPITNPVANLSIAQKIGIDLGLNTQQQQIDDENRIEEIVENVDSNRPPSPKRRKQLNPKQIVSVKEEAIDPNETDQANPSTLRCQFQGPYCAAFDTLEEIELHQKLYHSDYRAEECNRCLMRFPNGTKYKEHKQHCTKTCPKIEPTTTTRLPSTRRSVSEFHLTNS